MKIWFPYIYAGTGSDQFTKVLSEALRARGHEVIVSCFSHAWQYFPWRLFIEPVPAGTDIIVANSWNAFAFKRPKSKLVVVEHLFVLDPALGPYRSYAQSIFHNILVRYFVGSSYQAADKVVALSKYAWQRMVDVFPQLNPVIIRNGIDTDYFNPATDGKESLEGRKVRLLFVGNPTQRKGADLLPQIIRQLGQGFELYYTSGLHMEDTFRGISGMVPLGRLDRVGVKAAYRAADLFLFPSRLEGMPLAVMEALSCGTPAVVSDASSFPEMIQNSVNGRVCRKDDVCGMVDAIRDTVFDLHKLSLMGKAARESALEQFSLSRMVREYEQLLKSMLDPSQKFTQANKRHVDYRLRHSIYLDNTVENWTEQSDANGKAY